MIIDRVIPIALSVAIALCLLSSVALAQEESKELATFPKYRISYLGNTLINPGMMLSRDFVLKDKLKVKEKRKTKEKYRQLLHGYRVGAYRHPSSHSAAFTHYGIQYKRTGSRKWNHSIETGFGLYRSFLAPTYQMKNGEAKRVLLPGNFYFYPQMRYAFGRHLKKGDVNTEFTAAFSCFALLNYNNGVVPVINFELSYPLPF